VSLHGSNFTIRRVAKVPISVTQLIKWRTFSELAAAYMWIMISEGMSAFICGETASGKTTTLNALAVFIKPNYKIVSIEDTAEVALPHPNWVRELTRDTGKAESSVTMFDLLKAALRQRPNYIIVGEIRGAEGNIAFQAMQTGHPVLSTFHAANIERLLQRLTNPPISVPKTNLDNLNIAWFQSSVYDKKGLLVRRMISIYEVLGYDPKTDSIAALPVFVWDPVTDTHRFSGRGASYLLEEKVAVMRGIPRREINVVYEELELRARYLKLLAEKNVLDYYDVYRAVIKTYELGLEQAYKRLIRGDLL
ncbi:MAG: type II/IV secretion system ATPase subunit, partial [Desulfurococcaceae archaeon]